MKHNEQISWQKGRQAPPRLINKEDLADALRLSTRTIEGLMKQGLPHIKLKRAARFDVDDVIRFLKSRNQVGESCGEVRHD